MVYYFAYGANLDFENFKVRCPNAKIISAGVLSNHKLVFDKKSNRRFDIGFANIIYSERDQVEGVLSELSEDELRTLDRCEGYPNSYNRQEFEIKTDAGEFSAWAYVADTKATIEGLLPTKVYLDNIINCVLLTVGYRDKIKTIFNFLQWCTRSKEKTDPFDKFDNLWKSFNKYATSVFKPLAKKNNPNSNISENKLISEIKKHKDMVNLYAGLLSEDSFVKVLNIFRETICKGKNNYYVENMDTKEKIKFNNPDSFEQFMAAIYQVRCNSVHGEKIPFGLNDPKIVNAAYNILLLFLMELFKPFL